MSELTTLPTLATEINQYYELGRDIAWIDKWDDRKLEATA